MTYLLLIPTAVPYRVAFEPSGTYSQVVLPEPGGDIKVLVSTDYFTDVPNFRVGVFK